MLDGERSICALTVMPYSKGAICVLIGVLRQVRDYISAVTELCAIGRVGSHFKRIGGCDMDEYTEQDPKEFDLYGVLFPDRNLYRTACSCVKKQIIALFVTAAIVVLAAVELFPYMVRLYREGGNVGYVIGALIVGGELLVGIPQMIGSCRLRALLGRQEKTVHGTMAEAAVTESHGAFRQYLVSFWILCLIFGAVGACTAAIGAIFAPDALWACIGLIPVVLAVWLPERLCGAELKRFTADRQSELGTAVFRFCSDEEPRRLQAYQEIGIGYCNAGGDSSLYAENGGGDYSVYLGSSYLSLEVDSGCGRVGGFGGYFPAFCMESRVLSEPFEAEIGILYLDRCAAERGGGERIVFDGDIAYDATSHVLQLGCCDDGMPYLKIFRNLYVQLTRSGSLAGIRITDLNLPERD